MASLFPFNIRNSGLVSSVVQDSLESWWDCGISSRKEVSWEEKRFL